MRALLCLCLTLSALSCAAEPVLLPDAAVVDGGPCGGACGAGTVCVGGACVAVDAGQPADAGAVDAWSDAEAVDVADAVTVEDVGACRPACGPGAECVGVACRCMGTLRACAGACVDTTSDPANCGACGRACLAGQACNGGNCGCAPGRQTCGALGLCGSETATDIFNCGACGNRCATAQTCTAGRCVAADAGCAPLTQCEARCVDLMTSARDCGGCGRGCAAGPHSTSAECRAGGCIQTCEFGYADCDGIAVNGCEARLADSRFSCAACANACRTGLRCCRLSGVSQCVSTGC